MSTRTALVTGTAQGIGRAIARELAASGVRVVGVDVKPHEDPAIERVIVADLSRVDECLRVVSEAGEVDVLVNNAAVLVQEPFETFDMDDYEHVMAVNLRAPFLLGRELGPPMAARGWGRIVNISSIGARTGGLADSSVYSAAKAGLVAFTKNFARNLGPRGVTANAITPGAILTPMAAGIFERDPSIEARITADIPLRRFARPAEVATVAAFLASDEASYINGATIDVNGGWVMT